MTPNRRGTAHVWTDENGGILRVGRLCWSHLCALSGWRLREEGNARWTGPKGSCGKLDMPSRERREERCFCSLSCV